MAFGWTDTKEIAALLFERYDTLNPRSVKPTDMRKWVVDLEDFHGRAGDADDKTLQAIQTAWYQLWAEEFGS